jgi:hypothetical protein
LTTSNRVTLDYIQKNFSGFFSKLIRMQVNRRERRMNEVGKGDIVEGRDADTVRYRNVHGRSRLYDAICEHIVSGHDRRNPFPFPNQPGSVEQNVE